MTDHIDDDRARRAPGNDDEFEEEIEREIEASLAGPASRGALQSRFNRLPVWLRIACGGVLAAGGGVIAHHFHLPLPWLLGALFGSAALSVAGFSLPIPAFVRQYGQTVAGFAVGVFFTPEVGHQVLDLGLVILIASLASILISIVLSLPLARFGGCDRRSAFFAVIPGGLAEMAGLAHQFKANITVVSVAQSLRVVVIVLTVPAALTLYMHHARDAGVVHPPDMSTLMLVIGIALSALCAQVMNRLRIFNAFLLGGLVIGMAVGMTAEGAVAAPPYARAIAQIAIGASLGARFHWLTLRQAGPRFVPASIVATFLLIFANVAIAAAVAAYVDFPTAVLAASPGGIAEMALTAEALGLAPPIVAAWHFARILLVALLTAPLFRFWERRL
ncbi:AbrB family transcriptional regulator [Ancylobacter sp. FA202]|uniref:AbrB family transcriptional regulator n=1 Tax=Ancylobacter sp. FA202 TaxID=1111106 RepID=UPI000374B5B0|nr:AbrB family transcriptional regulator [Ancylobacter sp. FA202]